MAKNKNNNESSGDKTLDDSTSNNNLPITTMPKSNDELYNEVQALKAKPRYQSKIDEHMKALNSDNPNTALRTRKITLVSSGQVLDYSEIKRFPALSIKKFSLQYMFDLTEEQRKFIENTPLQYFARKRMEDIIK